MTMKCTGFVGYWMKSSVKKTSWRRSFGRRSIRRKARQDFFPRIMTTSWRMRDERTVLNLGCFLAPKKQMHATRILTMIRVGLGNRVIYQPVTLTARAFTASSVLAGE